MSKISANIKIRKTFILLFALFLLSDLAISYRRYASLNLDGDLVPIVLPSQWYSQVLKDPLGWKVLTEGEKYAATNRFWAHKSMDFWFNDFHKLYSYFWTDKIACLYSLQGLFDVLVHIALLFLLSMYVCGHGRFWRYDFLLVACIISPFFMTYGFNEIIGLVLNSVTYSFFYSLPAALFLLFFLPYYLAFYHNESIKQHFGWAKKLIWLFLALYLSFSGVILQPITLMVCGAILFNRWRILLPQKKLLDNSLSQMIQTCFKMEYEYSFYLLLFIFFSLYSFFIGTFNLENGTPIPFVERYERLLKGIWVHWTYKTAYWYVAILLIINGLGIIYVNKNYKNNKYFSFFLWGLLIISIYILLLPFGGYRPYRPNILRFDTILPMNIFLVWLIAFSSNYLLKNVNFNAKVIYLIPLLIILGVFYKVDDIRADEYYCQNDRLHRLQIETQEPIILNKDCYVLAWEPSNWDVHQHEVNQMLIRWGILTKEKQYRYE